MARQQDRRAETRARLLGAAAELFAARGIDGASIDAVAEAADRTSGAVYDHFGGKDGLLFALMDGWRTEAAEAIAAAIAADGPDADRLATLWRAFRDGAADPRWVRLEHELWSFAMRNPEARAHLERRYRQGTGGIEASFPGASGPAVLAALLGLSMVRAVLTDQPDDRTAIAVLHAAATTKELADAYSHL